MHGRMHPNYWQIAILLVVDLCSSLAYFMMTQPLPIAGKLPIKTLVAKQLPTNYNALLGVSDIMAACYYIQKHLKPLHNVTSGASIKAQAVYAGRMASTTPTAVVQSSLTHQVSKKNED